MATEAAAAAQGGKLRISKIVGGDIMCLRFIGSIDEDFDGANVAAPPRFVGGGGLVRQDVRPGHDPQGLRVEGGAPEAVQVAGGIEAGRSRGQQQKQDESRKEAGKPPPACRRLAHVTSPSGARTLPVRRA